MAINSLEKPEIHGLEDGWNRAGNRLANWLATGARAAVAPNRSFAGLRREALTHGQV
jgi:hypothetical protein